LKDKTSFHLLTVQKIVPNTGILLPF
jgi:hypothetical protein